MVAAIDFFRSIADDFTWQFSAAIVIIYALLKGATQSIWLTAALPYFKSLGVSGQTYQSYFTVTYLPWTLKAPLGVLVDIVPLFGYHKASYIVLASVGGVLAYLLMATLHLSTATAAIAAGLGFIITLQIAFVDLLTESKCAERMRDLPGTGANLVSFMMGTYYVGTLAGSLVSGPIADRMNPRNIFFVVAPLAAMPLVPVLTGWFQDERVPAARRRLRTDRLRHHSHLMKLALAMTASAAVTGVTATFTAPSTQAVVFIINATVLNGLAQLLLPRTMARASLYLFLSSFLQLNIQGASDYWFTADAECAPGGPHFSYTFFNTVGGISSSLGGAIAVALFQKYGRSANFRHAFLATVLLKIGGAFADLAIFTRVNLRFGVSDAVAFLFGDAVMQMIMMQLDILPAIVLITKVCPPGVEATVFALLASFMNTGRAGSRLAGVGLIDWAGIRTKAPCDFQHLPLVVVLGRILLPLLAIPAIPLLVPDVKMTDRVADDDGIPTENQHLL